VGRVPRNLWPIGERLEPRFGKLGREFKHIVFDKQLLTDDPTLEWVTPGHPLFEVVREEVTERVQFDLQHGAVFYDLQRAQPARLDVFSAAIRDGRGHVLHRRLFVVEAQREGTLTVRQPTLFLDVLPAPSGTAAPEGSGWPDRVAVERALIEQALQPFLNEISAQHTQEVETITRHLEISLNALIDRQQRRMIQLVESQEAGDTSPLLAANMKTTEDRLDELNGRLERRTEELAQERHCTISDIQPIGRAWVLPHPDRASPGLASMVRDEEIERIAVEAVTAYEAARGWQVQSVESENRGFDLISKKKQDLRQDEQDVLAAVRFIEVKGRAGVGEVALSSNEYKTAERLKHDYWLYVVYNCATKPEVHVIQDPIHVGWEPIVKVEHYHANAARILAASLEA